MSFFGQDILDSVNEQARRNPARPQATIGEAAESAFDLQVDQRSSYSAKHAIYEKYETYRSDLHSLTGKRLFNPYTPGFAQGQQRREDVFFEQVERLREQFEDDQEEDFPVWSPDEIRSRVAEDRRQQRVAAADVAQRSQGFLTNAAGFFGAAGAATIDPPVLLSLGFGLPFSSGIITGALVDAGLGIASETLVQLGVQLGRQEFGEEPDLREAAFIVAAAGGGGFALSALIRGGVKGTKALVARSKTLPDQARTSDVRAAEDYLTRQHELEASNPFPETNAGRMLHQEELDAAMARLMQTDTAIGRILAADDPIRLEVTEGIPLTRGATIAASRAAREALNPALFARAAEVQDRLAAIAARTEEIDARLTGRPDEATSLQRQLKETTDKRKIKRLKRKIAKAEKAAGKPIGKQAAAEKAQRTRLAREKNKLAKEVPALEREARKLGKRAEQVGHKVKLKRTKQQVFNVKQVIGDAPDRTSVKARQAADFATQIEILNEMLARTGKGLGAEVKRDAARQAAGQQLGAEDFATALERDAVRSAPGTPAQPARAHDTSVAPDARAAAVPEEAADIKVKDETVEAQIRALADEAPETKIEVVGEDGSVRTITTKEMLNDLADDETLLKELRSCIAGLA